MERLSATSELLDGPLRDAAALEANLRDLAYLNRRFGAAALSARCLARLAPEGDALTVLDVGTGAADIPADLIADARRRGRALTVTAVDNRPEVIDAALRIDPGLASLPGLTLDVADGAALPYPDGAFDVAHSSMVLHHLEPEPAVAFLRELRRVSRRGVVTNDLARGLRFWIAAVVVTRVAARGAYTRHDGPLSVRRAYTTGEARELLARAGLRPVHVARGLGRHRWAIAAAPA